VELVEHVLIREVELTKHVLIKWVKLVKLIDNKLLLSKSSFGRARTFYMIVARSQLYLFSQNKLFFISVALIPPHSELELIFFLKGTVEAV